MWEVLNKLHLGFEDIDISTECGSVLNNNEGI